MRTSTSPCGRFIVLDGLHLDRQVFERLEQLAIQRGLRIQDAIQLALCAFGAGPLYEFPVLPQSSASLVACAPGIKQRD